MADANEGRVGSGRGEGYRKEWEVRRHRGLAYGDRRSNYLEESQISGWIPRSAASTHGLPGSEEQPAFLSYTGVRVVRVNDAVRARQQYPRGGYAHGGASFLLREDERCYFRAGEFMFQPFRRMLVPGISKLALFQKHELEVVFSQASRLTSQLSGEGGDV